MAKIAETIVEEWLHRQGYLTVRSLKDVNEIDLLAYRPKTGEALHVEVNDSPEPQGFLGGSNARPRLRESVEGYVRKKYLHDRVVELRKSLSRISIRSTVGVSCWFTTRSKKRRNRRLSSENTTSSL